jgi:hypothetical protein
VHAPAAFLDIKVLYLKGVIPYKVAPLLYVIAHQNAKEPVRFAGIVKPDTKQGPAGRIHRRLPELLRIHLPQTFEALYFNALATDLPDCRADIRQRSHIVAVWAVKQGKLSGQRLAGNGFLCL